MGPACYHIEPVCNAQYQGNSDQYAISSQCFLRPSRQASGQRQMSESHKPLRLPWGILIATLIALAILLSLGTWQVQRLMWKEALIASTQERIHETPLPLAGMEKIYRDEGTVDYRPVTVSGTFMHPGERHFLATYSGAS